MTGIIAGNGGGITGVAPEASIVFAKVQSSQICGQSALDGDLVGAIDWIVSNRARFGIDILNMSLGGGQFSSVGACERSSPALTNVLNLAETSGIVTFASSGNSGLCQDLVAPRAWGVCAPFLDILAPSECAESSTTGSNVNDCFGGTSAASPFAAGVAALAVDAAGASLSRAQLRSALRSNGDDITDSRNGRVTPRVNAINTVLALGDTVEDCSDGVDNDGDGAIDCADSECSGAPACTDTGTCSVIEDFENGATGWSNSASSTCSTGAYVLGSPSTQSTDGVVTQVGGASSGTTAVFTAANTSLGQDDVDGGECILDSPNYSVGSNSTLSVSYFHGQRDSGDDSSDFFALEVSLNGGQTYQSLVSNGDTRQSAQWRSVSASIPAGSDVRLRMRCSDGAGAGDIVECGIDDIEICGAGR